MANTIKLKRGTSTPSTSDISSGEVAIDTSAKKLYINDSGTVKEIGGTTNASNLSSGTLPNARLATTVNVTALTATTTTVTTSNATSFVGSGDLLTSLRANQLTSGTVAAARLDTATTQSAGNNSTKIATTAYTDTAISNLVDSSPSALNTLNELAAALGDDANFSTTVTNSIATKLPLAGGTITGSMSMTGNVFDFTDNKQLRFGTGNDFEVFFNGTDQYLKSKAGKIRLQVVDGESAITCNPNAGIELFYDNSKKAETVSGGFTVTGTATADTITGSSGDHTLTSSGSNSTLSLNSTGTNSKVKLKASGSNGSIQMTAVSDIKFYSGTDFQTQTFEAKSGGVDVYGNCLIRSGGELRLGDDDNSNRVGFKAPSTVSSDQIWTLPAADGSANTSLTTDGSGNLSWASATDSTKLPLAGGTMTGNLLFGDDVKAIFGAGSDLQIFHDSSETTDRFRSTGTILLQPASGENGIAVNANGSVDLCFNGTKKFESTTNGTKTTGRSHITQATNDTDLTNEAGPGFTNGLVVENTQAANGVWAALTALAYNAATTNQSASFIAKSVASGHAPEIHITQRTASNAQTTALKIDTSQNAIFAGNISVTGTVDGVDIATRDTLFGGITSSSGVLTDGVAATTQSTSDNTTKVATTAFTQSAIGNATITGSQISTNAISTTKVADNAITTAKLAADAVTAAKLSNNIVDDNKLTANAVITSKIANDAVTTDKINLISTSSVPSLEAKGDGSSQDGYIQLNCSQNSHGVKLKSPPHSANASYTLTLPNTDGNSNQVLKTDGSGGLDWVDQTAAYTNASVDAHLNQSNPTSGHVLSWNGSDYAWVAQSGGGGGGISNLVEDTTPQLGGNLDMQSNNITGTGTITATSVASSASGMRKITASTSTPSGGADGDIHIKYS